MEKMLTLEEAAQIVGVSRRTILRWEEERKFSGTKRDKNGCRVYSFDDVEKMMAIRFVKWYL